MNKNSIPNTPLLQVKNLSAAYGRMPVLHHIDMHIEEGEIVALIGANGAGKSSLLQTLMRLPAPEAPRLSSGDILMDGRSLANVPTYKIVNDYKMTLCPEGRHVFGNLSVRENLVLAASGNNRRELQTVFSLFPRLAERQKQRADTLSGGEQQMLAVGRALMTRCKILLLDEPSMGLAPLLIETLFEALAELNRQGLSILLVEQNAALALEVASRAYVLETGSIVLQGPAKELGASADIHSAYLG